VLAAVRQSLGLLLEKAEFLEVVRRQAHQVALPGDRDLQRLTNPPGGVGRQAGAMADVEAIDGLHQAAHRFLEQVRIAQGMVTEALGDVRRQADVGRGEAVLAVDVAVVELANLDGMASLAVTVITDELGHRPRLLRRRTVRAQAGEMTDQSLDQFLFAFPEGIEELALFFRGQKVGRKDRRRGVNGNSFFGRRAALATLRLHGRASSYLKNGSRAT